MRSTVNVDKEVTLLLAFSNDLASVRDIAGLKSVIRQYLSARFHLREYIITLPNEDRETYRYFLHDLPGKDPDDEGFRIITGDKMPITGAMTGAVLRSTGPVIFDIEEVRRGKFSFPSASFWRRAGAKQIRGMRLKVGDQDIGIIWTQPGKIDDALLKGLSAQIAIAISNILAYEKIAGQLAKLTWYKQRLEEEKVYLQQEIQSYYPYNTIAGNGREMQKAMNLASQVMTTDSTVLLLGETGTGKEVMARAIHNGSPRKLALMVKVNCATLPPQLAESELFGHEKGSFTGAHERRIGKFELANNGTLFLDEIGDMPPELQVKLLRVIQEKEIERVGGKNTIRVNVRIIAATNRDLQQEVLDGRFRSDLFYRLNVFPITLPPLRERKDDIPALAKHFIGKVASSTGRSVKGISGHAMRKLIAYGWPGNVRELEHLIERTFLLTPGETIREVNLSPSTPRLGRLQEESGPKTLADAERDHIISTLNQCGGKVFGPGGAAAALGVPASTLNSRIKKLGIKKNHLIN